MALVTEDFSLQGPMQVATGRSALRNIVEHVATNARGHQVLRQWQDGNDVCTIYRFSVQTGGEATCLLVSEWNTVRSGHVASSLMVFDTASLPRSRTTIPATGM